MNKRLVVLKVALTIALALSISISTYAQGGTTGPLTWSINGGTLTISGSGAMPNYNSTSAPWYQYRNSITELVIENGVTTIGNYAFNECINIEINLDFLDGITRIGTGAFLNCSKLPSLTIPNSLETIYSNAFSGCRNLKTVIIEDGTISLTFYNSGGTITYFENSPIETLYLGRNLNNPTNGVPFRDHPELKSLTIGEDVTKINSNSFYNCTGLQSLTFGNSLTSIGDNAFRDCISLKNSIIIPSKVKEVGHGCFQGCSNLQSVTIPNSVTTIYSNAFSGCRNLKTVIIEDGTISLIFYNSGGTITYFENSPIETLYLGRNLNNPTNGVPFRNNSALKLLTVGEHVTNINANSFYNCTGLTQITSHPCPPPTIQSNTFNGVTKSIPVYVNCECLSDYQTAQHWSAFNNIICDGSANLELLSLTVNGTLYQNKTGTISATFKNSGKLAYNSRLWAYMEKPVTFNPHQTIGSDEVYSIAVGETKTITFTGIITLPPDTYDCNVVFDANNNPDNMDIYQFHNVLGVQAKVHPDPSAIFDVEISSLTIYPNPVKDELFINSESHITKVEIHSLTGSLMLIENNFNEKISVSDLPKGFYIVRVYTDNGLVVRKFFKE